MDELRHLLNCEEWLDAFTKLRNVNRKTKSKGAKEISLKLNRPAVFRLGTKASFHGPGRVCNFAQNSGRGCGRMGYQRRKYYVLSSYITNGVPMNALKAKCKQVAVRRELHRKLTVILNSSNRLAASALTSTINNAYLAATNPQEYQRLIDRVLRTGASR
jgi:hypothetical protein